jgi:hypothetical protein
MCLLVQNVIEVFCINFVAEIKKKKNLTPCASRGRE